MSSSPLVSVVMSVYKGEKYLAEAIESILNQTFRDFEFIIIDDGSTDSTPQILEQYREADSRVHIYSQENRGLIASLNRGCRLAKGKYIARMDADDISLPARFARQVKFLSEHADIGVLGTWIEYIDENGNSTGTWRMPVQPEVVDWALLFGTCLAHPSVMMRRTAVEQVGWYHAGMLYAEDYDLWSRMRETTLLANLPDTLVQRRVLEESICAQHTVAQEERAASIMQVLQGSLLGNIPSMDAVVALRRMVSDRHSVTLDDINVAVDLMEQLYRAYLKTHKLNLRIRREISRDVGRRLYSVASLARRLSVKRALPIFVRSVYLNPRLFLSRAMAVAARRSLGRL